MIHEFTEPECLTHTGCQITVQPWKLQQRYLTEPHRGDLTFTVFINTNRINEHLRLNAALDRAVHNVVWRNSIHALTQLWSFIKYETAAFSDGHLCRESSETQALVSWYRSFVYCTNKSTTVTGQTPADTELVQPHSGRSSFKTDSVCFIQSVLCSSFLCPWGAQ